MAAVLRVKRRCDEEPLEALVLACKRRKESENDPREKDNRFATILKFTTTVKAQENDLSVLLPTNEREDIWKSRLSHKVDISKKIREQRKQVSENSRFKVVNCFRHVDAQEDCERDAEKKNIIIFDIESSEQNMKEDVKKSVSQDDAGYVYDIYYGQTSNEYDFTSLDHLVDIMPFSSFDFGTDGASDNESVEEEDDDSNDENNWRNDYPDSDHSINEDDMRLAMQMGDMNIGNDLSSSDDEIIYGVEADPQDVEYYGEVYAKYKARIRQEFNEEEIAATDEENESSFDGSGGIGSDDENEDPVLRFM